MLSKANLQVQWCLHLCMHKTQGGKLERSTYLFRCHLHSVAADGITAHSTALRKHQPDIEAVCFERQTQVTGLPG